MFNPWRILKGKESRSTINQRITVPKARWDPKVFRLPSFRDNPMYDKLKRITGMGTDIHEILDYFEDEGIIGHNETWSREEITERFKDATELDKFAALDFLLEEHLNAAKVTRGRTLGEAGGINTRPREVDIEILEGTDSFGEIYDYIDASKLSREENPLSIVEFNKDKEQSLYDYILPRIGNENNIESKFETNFIGPNNEVKVKSFFSEEAGQLPDGIADAMIGLLKGGSHFGYMIMNKDGKYKRGSDRTAQRIQGERPMRFLHDGKTPDDWKQTLERDDKEVGTGDYDWSAISVVKQGKMSGAKQGKPKWYINFVAVFHGETPMFWAGIRVEWDAALPQGDRAKYQSMLNEGIKDWRKW